MKSCKWIGFLTLLSCFSFVGCGGESGTQQAADPNDIAAWAAAHPEAEDGLEADTEVIDEDTP